MNHFRTTRYLAGVGLLALGVAACVPETPPATTTPTTTTSTTTTSTTQPPAECVPQSATVTNGDVSLSVSPATCLEAGDVITVTGAGYTTTGNLATRPPLAGMPAGVYVVQGEYADNWRPSLQAPASSRQGYDQVWAVPTASYNASAALQADPAAQPFDGSFSYELTVTEPENSATHPNVGVVTYAAGGSTNAGEEILVPLSLDG